VLMKARAGFTDMVDISGLGYPAFSPTFTVTCEDLTSGSSGDAFTLLIEDQNTRTPTFELTNGDVVNVDLHSYEADAVINSAVPITVRDQDLTEEHGTVVEITVVYTKDPSIPIVIIKQPLVLPTRPADAWVTNVELILAPGVGSGTYVIKLTATDGAGLTAEHDITITVFGPG